MRRRLSIGVVIVSSIGSAFAAPALAADPTVDGRLPGADLPVLAGPSPAGDDASDNEIESVPGTNGSIAFTATPVDGVTGGYLTPSEIGLMTDGGNLSPDLTDDSPGSGALEPAWSPGGTLVAFSRDTTQSLTDFPDDIFLITSKAGGLRQLTRNGDADITPSWFPSGDRLVFASDRSGAFEIYSMRLDGTGVKRLTNAPGQSVDPSVSPDGQRIAFASDRTGDYEIYTMKTDGSGVTRLTASAGEDYAPDWSPDGLLIAFTSVRTGNAEIFSMGADGSSETNRTNHAGYHDQRPSWSPDGAFLLFDAFSSDDLDVWRIPSGGGTRQRVGTTADGMWDPDWQPVPAFPLVDARFSSFEDDIVWVYEQGITTGCSPERYCPTDPVTREQMAIFLDRALDLPTTATDFFSDDEGRTGEAAINRVAAAGITSGCGPGLYCPTGNVTRGQMASFLARAFDLPATTTDFFTDDDGTTHEANIDRVAAAGITSGCGPTTYCPTANVTRGQMAAFLRRALED